jgi:hypothetical protein
MASKAVLGKIVKAFVERVEEETLIPGVVCSR